MHATIDLHAFIKLTSDPYGTNLEPVCGGFEKVSEYFDFIF
jgi:hypothetical protein